MVYVNTRVMGDKDEDLKAFAKLKLTKEQSMSSGASFHASAVIKTAAGPRVVIFGGQRSGMSEEMWVLETSGDGWTQCFKPTEATPWPAARTQMTLNSLGAEPQTRLVLFGGYVLNRAEQNDVWECEMTTDVGEVFANWNACDCAGEPPKPRYGHSATVQGKFLAVFGGQGQEQQFNDVWLLDTAEGAFAWSQPSMSGTPPSPRSNHLALAVTVPEKAAFIHGGMNRDVRCLSDAHTLVVAADGSSATWKACEINFGAGGAPPPRAQHAGAILPSKPNHGFIFGGYDGGRNLQDLLVFKLDFQGGPAIRDVPCGPAPEARCRHSAHIIGSQLFVLGGYNGTLPWAPDVYCTDSEDAAGLFGKLAAGVPKSIAPKKKTNEKAQDEAAELAE